MPLSEEQKRDLCALATNYGRAQQRSLVMEINAHDDLLVNVSSWLDSARAEGMGAASEAVSDVTADLIARAVGVERERCARLADGRYETELVARDSSTSASGVTRRKHDHGAALLSVEEIGVALPVHVPVQRPQRSETLKMAGQPSAP